MRLLEARVGVTGDEASRDRRLLRGDARDAVSQWLAEAAKAALHERLQQQLAQGDIDIAVLQRLLTLTLTLTLTL